MSANTAASAGIRRPSTFLSLVPVQSDSYPKNPASPPPTSISNNLVEPSALSLNHTCHHCGSKIAPPSPEIKAVSMETRSVRSNSDASDLGSPSKNRFLKLGPVHWGGDSGDNGYAIEF